ncbi:MAG: alpha/beta hydrolase [Bacillota bacterium]|nr:alpha/beta hydrolase [Bacillota bacterium]
MFLPMQDRRIYYEDVGNGPAILLIHGLGGSTRYWASTMSDLSQKGFRVVAVDLPGFGRSDLPQKCLNVSDYVDVVDFVTSSLNIDTFSIVGCSMGGLVAWMYAAAFPHRVSKTILVSPVGLPSALSKPIRKLRRKPSSIPSPAYMRLPGLGAILKFCAHIAFTKVIAYPVVCLAVARPALLNDESFRIMRTSAREMRVMHKGLLLWRGPEDPAQLLQNIKSPTLIVWGAKDRILPRTAPEYYLGHIPQAKFILYPNSGHVPMLEIPEEFNRDIIAFIKGEHA